MLTACFCRKLQNHTLLSENNNQNHTFEQKINNEALFVQTKKPNANIWLLNRDHNSFLLLDR